jgi:hypothetical protein
MGWRTHARLFGNLEGSSSANLIVGIFAFSEKQGWRYRLYVPSMDARTTCQSSAIRRGAAREMGLEPTVIEDSDLDKPYRFACVNSACIPFEFAPSAT